METKNKIKIGLETEGMEEAAAKIEALRDAAESFPAAVNIKAINADAVHISSTNIIDRSAENTQTSDAITPLAAAMILKNHCSATRCNDCEFKTKDTESCVLDSDAPEEWSI